MLADLEYNCADPLAYPLLATRAGLTFEDAVEVSWPLIEINKALEFVYNGSMALPQIYNIWFMQRVIGQLVMPRDDNLSNAERFERFIDVLRKEGRVWTENGKLRFLADLPYVTSGTWGGQTVGVVAYPPPLRLNFPDALVNEAIWKLMGHQDNWPQKSAVFAHPAMEAGSDSLLRGLVLGEPIKGLNEVDGIGRALLLEVHACNKDPHGPLYNDFKPRKRVEFR